MSDQPTVLHQKTPAERAPKPPSAAARATAEAAGPQMEPAPSAAPVPGSKSGGFFWGTGRRKTSVARVRIKSGEGKYIINDREIEKHFFGSRDRGDIIAPLKATKTFGKYDVFVNVHGGGQTGQAGAVVLGLARALVKADPNLEDTLRDGRFLTRDDRKVERKKPGQPGARKRFQFSKR